MSSLLPSSSGLHGFWPTRFGHPTPSVAEGGMLSRMPLVTGCEVSRRHSEVLRSPKSLDFKEPHRIQCHNCCFESVAPRWCPWPSSGSSSMVRAPQVSPSMLCNPPPQKRHVAIGNTVLTKTQVSWSESSLSFVSGGFLFEPRSSQDSGFLLGSRGGGGLPHTYAHA